MLLNPIDLSLKINEIFHQDEYEYFILLNYYARMIFVSTQAKILLGRILIKIIFLSSLKRELIRN